jgi:hypothetical protein
LLKVVDARRGEDYTDVSFYFVEFIEIKRSNPFVNEKLLIYCYKRLINWQISSALPCLTFKSFMLSA